MQLLIVDLRNNPGGSIEVINELLSYFLTEPSVPVNSYKKVNSNSTYESFKYSNNHSKDEIMFGDYVPMKDKTGYYLFPESPTIIMPDSLVNYPGRLYLLTDETSVSAATDFSAKVGLDEQELLRKKIERTQRALDKLNARLSAAIC